MKGILQKKNGKGSLVDPQGNPLTVQQKKDSERYFREKVREEVKKSYEIDGVEDGMYIIRDGTMVPFSVKNYRFNDSFTVITVGDKVDEPNRDILRELLKIIENQEPKFKGLVTNHRLKFQFIKKEEVLGNNFYGIVDVSEGIDSTLSVTRAEIKEGIKISFEKELKEKYNDNVKLTFVGKDEELVLLRVKKGADEGTIKKEFEILHRNCGGQV